MLTTNQNSRANTVISKSFIAEDFQGYSDPYNTTAPTSALNQMTRSKQVSNSGISNQVDQHSFGFGNITTSNRNIDNQQTSYPNAFSNNYLNSSNSNGGSSSQHNIQQQGGYGGQQSYQQSLNNQYENQHQQNLNNQYSSSNNYQTDYSQQQYQQPQIQHSSSNSRLNHTQLQYDDSSFNHYRPEQTNSFTPQIGNNINSVSSRYEQTSSSNVVGGGRPSQSTSGVSQRFKLNISEEFSNSFTLKCVNEPEKSSIMDMKRRQREFRKSIQNSQF